MRSKESRVGDRRFVFERRCSGRCPLVGNPLDIGNRYSPGDGKICPCVSAALLFDLFLSMGVRKKSREGGIWIGSAFSSSEFAGFSSRTVWCGGDGDWNLGDGAFGELTFGSGNFSTSVTCFGRGGNTNPARWVCWKSSSSASPRRFGLLAVRV